MSHCVRWTPSPQDVVLFIFFIALAVMILEYESGCAPRERVIQSPENADAVKAYAKLLDPCVEKARAAKNIDAYKRCVDDVDAMLCISNAAFCNDGGAR